jgi:tyrosinase
MRTSFLSATMAVAVGVHALPQITPATPLAPAIPLNLFDTKKFAVPLSLDDILGGNFPKPSEIIDNLPLPKAAAGILGGLFPSQNGAAQKETVENKAVANTMSTQATCSNPRVRQEWDSYSDSDRQAFVNAVRCLMGKPASGQFSQAKSRYEDLVALHQTPSSFSGTGITCGLLRICCAASVVLTATCPGGMRLGTLETLPPRPSFLASGWARSTPAATVSPMA